MSCFITRLTFTCGTYYYFLVEPHCTYTVICLRTIDKCYSVVYSYRQAKSDRAYRDKYRDRPFIVTNII
jgi:hypothetical protein